MAQKLLVIDDSQSTARLVESILQQSIPGCDILTASRGLDGFERFSVANPDVVLLSDTLPDMDSESILERFASDPTASQLAVILMVDPARETNLNGRFPNVVRVLTKPVSSEALIDAISGVLATKANTRRAIPGRGNSSAVVFSGHTGFFSLRQSLQMAQGDRLTGVLRYFLGRQPIELYISGGRFQFATTKNFGLYCAGSPVILSATSLGLIIEGQVNQQITGCPIFLFLSARNGFPHDDVVQITREHGQRLVAQLYTAGRVNFEFEETDRIPEFARTFPGGNEDADNFILSALRHVRFDQLPPAQRPDPNGSPAYTRRGYEMIQKLKLNEVEGRFATAINGADSLQAIAQKLSIPLNDALLIVFRFQSLEIIDFWSSIVLSLPGSSEESAHQPQ